MMDQSWYWTRAWQRGERAAEADLAAGRYTDFDDPRDAVTWLGAVMVDDLEFTCWEDRPGDLSQQISVNHWPQIIVLGDNYIDEQYPPIESTTPDTVTFKVLNGAATYHKISRDGELWMCQLGNSVLDHTWSSEGRRTWQEAWESEHGTERERALKQRYGSVDE